MQRCSNEAHSIDNLNEKSSDNAMMSECTSFDDKNPENSSVNSFDLGPNGKRRCGPGGTLFENFTSRGRLAVAREHNLLDLLFSLLFGTSDLRQGEGVVVRVGE